MIFLFIIFIIFVIFSVYFHLRYRNEKSKITNNQLYGHGARTSLNGFENLISINYIYIFIIFFGSPALYFHISVPRLLVILLTGFTILPLGQSLYMFTEIKHLTDGLIKHRQNSDYDKFYKHYALDGVIAFTLYSSLVYIAHPPLVFTSIIIIAMVTGYLLGMGGLLDLTGMNDMDSSRSSHALSQTIKLFTERPKRILIGLFTAAGRKAFIKELRGNTNYICKSIISLF